AEDGIRDLTVTGVQTCALPISTVGGDAPDREAELKKRLAHMEDERRQHERNAANLWADGRERAAEEQLEAATRIGRAMQELKARSEERRVGKEGRCGGGAVRVT